MNIIRLSLKTRKGIFQTKDRIEIYYIGKTPHIFLDRRLKTDKFNGCREAIEHVTAGIYDFGVYPA